MTHPHDDRLYPYQLDGVRRLLYSPALLLADEMGLGKTVQVITAIRALFSAGAARRVLVVCPSSLVLTWRHEFAKWAPDIPVVLYRGGDRFGLLEGGAPVLISSIETIVSDLNARSLRGELFVDIGIDILVLDEAQRIKNADSLSSNVLSRVVSPRRWALSGTPLENRPSELGSILRFLQPNEFMVPADLDDLPRILSMPTSTCCGARRAGWHWSFRRRRYLTLWSSSRLSNDRTTTWPWTAFASAL